MTMQKYRIHFIVFLYLLLNGSNIIYARDRIAPLIINHNYTNILKIPEYAIIQAKKKLHIAYGHTSHGSQLTDGMSGLVEFVNNGGMGLKLAHNIFNWNEGGKNGALDLHDYAFDGDVGVYPYWVKNTRSYLGLPDKRTGRGINRPQVNVIVWSWCGQVDDKYRNGTLFEEYLKPMSDLENEYPGINFIYMTGYLNYWFYIDIKAGNQVIREFCIKNNKILYDFADIESYDPDGNYFEYANANCDYYKDTRGKYLGNWAKQWQDSHVEGTEWFNCRSAHTQPLNANQKAYAAWWLWAALAGWDGEMNK